MKEAYLPELNEMYWKVVGKLQQHDNLPQQPNNDQVEKLKVFKELLERIISFLQVPKNNIVPALKEKLGGYEKLIINFLNSNSPRKLGPTMQQPQQIPAYHMQQQQSQISQVQPRENSMGSQVRPMDVQGSVNTLQQNNIASLQHNSSSSLLGVPNASHDIMDSLQSNSNVDSGHENPPNTMQQVDVGMQQSVSAPQQGVAEPIMDIGDWRADLQQESRQRMVYRIIDTLKMGVLDFGPEGLEETEKIGARFEESIYNTATSQSDYMRKISLKMLAMGSFFQNTVVDSLPYDSASNGQDLEDAVSAIPFS